MSTGPCDSLDGLVYGFEEQSGRTRPVPQPHGDLDRASRHAECLAPCIVSESPMPQLADPRFYAAATRPLRYPRRAESLKTLCKLGREAPGGWGAPG